MTGYPWDMSNTPSDPNHINPKALEGFMRAFDRVISGKFNAAQPHEVEQVTMVEACERTVKEVLMGKHTRPSLWHPIKSIIRFRDTLRLRKYNRKWIKNNIH